MKKKYWSGSTRLTSDLFWCLALALITPIAAGYPIPVTPYYLPHSMEGYFFIFFFWSWNENHLKNKFARIAVHALMGFDIFSVLFAFYALLSGHRVSIPFFSEACFLISVIISFFAIRKYLRIFKRYRLLLKKEPLKEV